MSVQNTHEGALKVTNYLQLAATTGGSVYFIGVGGVMMSSLALLTKKAGYPVLGSDRAAGPAIASLREAGITVFPDHKRENLPADCALVVYTVAISPDNPEYLAARERGIPCLSRADYLGGLMTDYRHRIGVAGMHGKSTCTSILSQILLDAAVDPTILSGAEYPPMGGAFRTGDSREHFLFEACEYMDSFLDLSPTVAVLLNAEWEHVDYFRDLGQVVDSFARFASLTGPCGVTVVNADCPHSMEAARRALGQGGTGTLVTFSAEGAPHADFRAASIRMEGGLPVFELVAHGESWGEVFLSVPGRFQVNNALAAAAAAHACGISREAIRAGLSHYVSCGRRMEKRGELEGVVYYDDYGHHPTEVRATLEGAAALTRARSPEGRLFCLFQPHTYSRTARLYGDFLTAFDAADRLLLLDIYAAREENIYGVSSATLAEDLNRSTPHFARRMASPAEAADLLRAETRPGDTVVIMGAGDVIGVSRLLFS